MTRGQAIYAFQQLRQGVSQRVLAKRLGLSQVTISHLLVGRTHSEFAHLRVHPFKRTRAEAVLKDLAAGLKPTTVARRHGMSVGNVRSIARGETWKELERCQEQ